MAHLSKEMGYLDLSTNWKQMSRILTIEKLYRKRRTLRRCLWERFESARWDRRTDKHTNRQID
jgi:hypothetical protein